MQAAEDKPQKFVSFTYCAYKASGHALGAIWGFLSLLLPVRVAVNEWGAGPALAWFAFGFLAVVSIYNLAGFCRWTRRAVRIRRGKKVMITLPSKTEKPLTPRRIHQIYSGGTAAAYFALFTICAVPDNGPNLLRAALCLLLLFAACAPIIGLFWWMRHKIAVEDAAEVPPVPTETTTTQTPARAAHWWTAAETREEITQNRR